MVRLKAEGHEIDAREILFQFLMVRLKEPKGNGLYADNVVSIPYGTIKRNN